MYVPHGAWLCQSKNNETNKVTPVFFFTGSWKKKKERGEGEGEGGGRGEGEGEGERA
jgi:hypothetical protein